MANTIDWHLVLEFVRALAGPTATVVSVALVARLGALTFRSQKALERRLEWYQDVHTLLGQAADAFSLAAASEGDADIPRAQARIERANALTQKLGARVHDAWLYADQDGLDAIQRFTTNFTTWLADLPTAPRANATRIANLCLLTADALSKGMRSHLGLSRLQIRNSVLPLPSDLAT